MAGEHGEVPVPAYAVTCTGAYVGTGEGRRGYWGPPSTWIVWPVT